MWGIACYFNPNHFENRIKNYKIFRKTTKTQNLKLCTIQLVYGKDAPDLLATDADLMITIRCKRKKNCMWQKERLLNIALERLPDECTKVCWLDCDLIFADNDWVSKAEAKLDTHNIIQPFTTLAYLPKKWETKIATSFALTCDSSYTIHCSFAFLHECNDASDPKNILNQFPNITHTSHLGIFVKNWFANSNNLIQVSTWGHGWGAKRSFLEKLGGFYDRCIVGGGDSIFKQIIPLPHNQLETEKYTGKHLADISEWIEKGKKIVQNEKIKVGCIDGLVLHMYHGKYVNRQYRERYNILKDHNFDPQQDIVLNKDDVYRWNWEKEGEQSKINKKRIKQMRKKMKRFFKKRKEDK